MPRIETDRSGVLQKLSKDVHSRRGSRLAETAMDSPLTVGF
jgi:hypothetical protein